MATGTGLQHLHLRDLRATPIPLAPACEHGGYSLRLVGCCLQWPRPRLAFTSGFFTVHDSANPS